MSDLRDRLDAVVQAARPAGGVDVDALWAAGRRRARNRRFGTLIGAAAATCVMAGAVFAVSTPTPPPESERLIGRATSTAMDDCFASHGFVKSGDHYEFGSGDEEEYRRFRALSGACAPPDGPPTREQVMDDYQAQTATAQCLSALGHDQPVPTAEQFLEQRRPMMEARQRASGPIWIAYNGVVNVSEEEWVRINKACPQP